ncbi:MAG: hypothetical protein AAF639_44210, partial [Chloroflexota bacterium]
YTLHFIQSEGWGWFEFTLSQGGGPISHTLALLFGFFMACAVVAGGVLVLLVALKLYILWSSARPLQA